VISSGSICFLGFLCFYPTVIPLTQRSMKTILILATAAALHAQPELLKKECLGCHGDGQTLSGLDLRTRDAMLKGGVRGPALVPGNSEASLLYQALLGKRGLQMPPKKLSAVAIASIKTWIDSGAPWNAPEEAKWKYKDEDLWGFRPVRPRDRTKTIDD